MASVTIDSFIVAPRDISKRDFELEALFRQEYAHRAVGRVILFDFFTVALYGVDHPSNDLLEKLRDSASILRELPDDALGDYFRTNVLTFFSLEWMEYLRNRGKDMAEPFNRALIRANGDPDFYKHWEIVGPSR